MEKIFNFVGNALTLFIIPANIIEWCNMNKVVFNVLFLIIISILTVIYWFMRIINNYKKSKLERQKQNIEISILQRELNN